MKKALMLVVSSLMFSSLSFAAGFTGTGSFDEYNYTGGTITREYSVYLPKSYSGSEAVPMIMVLHGCAMNDQDAIDYWDWDLIADQNNVIIVFPFVTRFYEMRNENCWGYWTDQHVQRGRGGEADDLYGIAKEVDANYNIDPKRRYITGISSGAAMAVAEGVVYNDYWTAIASVSGLPYGDGSTSVTADQFIYGLDYFVNKIIAQRKTDRAIPLMIMNSLNDTVVLPKNAYLMRDSHLTAFGADLTADATGDCTEEGIACEVVSYSGANGELLVETYLYNGLTVGPRTGSYGVGHYWSGGEVPAIGKPPWTWEKGPTTTTLAWDFFKNITSDGSEVVEGGGEGSDEGSDEGSAENSCPTFTGKVDPDLIDAGYVNEKWGFYSLTGDGESVWSYTGQEYTVYIGSDGKAYISDPMDCVSDEEGIEEGIIEEGVEEGIIEEGVEEGIIEEGVEEGIIEEGIEEGIVEEGIEEGIVEEGISEEDTYSAAPYIMPVGDSHGVAEFEQGEEIIFGARVYVNDNDKSIGVGEEPDSLVRVEFYIDDDYIGNDATAYFRVNDYDTSSLEIGEHILVAKVVHDNGMIESEEYVFEVIDKAAVVEGDDEPSDPSGGGSTGLVILLTGAVLGVRRKYSMKK